MKRSEKDIEKLTSEMVKNLGTDSPSDDFTQKVMQSVLKQNQPVSYSSEKKYWWLFLSIPMLVIITWFVMFLFNFSAQINQIAYNVYNSIGSFFYIFRELHPVYLISIISIFLLLSAEEIIRLNSFHKSKTSSNF